jgi:4a-hydroxytetrahydrobiopterin dehydratase
MSEINPGDLLKKKCRPCEAGGLPLSAPDVERMAGGLSGWEIEENKKIRKEFRFKNFIEAMAFVNKLAAIAESEQHHPALFISYNKVKVTLTTHAVGGLSENDFIMAAKIDSVLLR